MEDVCIFYDLTTSRYRDIFILGMKGEIRLPVLSIFYGIIIRMYFLQSEHNPPHIHAIYNNDAATINIINGEVLNGHLPAKALAMVQEWVLLHQETLLEIWRTQDFKKVPPLD